MWKAPSKIYEKASGLYGNRGWHQMEIRIPISHISLLSGVGRGSGSQAGWDEKRGGLPKDAETLAGRARMTTSSGHDLLLAVLPC
jgi:hypothetical protein